MSCSLTVRLLINEKEKSPPSPTPISTGYRRIGSPSPPPRPGRDRPRRSLIVNPVQPSCLIGARRSVIASPLKGV
ncbi:MAG: hypothetical protein U0841_07190 [Chloroflexia bacterium]